MYVVRVCVSMRQELQVLHMAFERDVRRTIMTKCEIEAHDTSVMKEVLMARDQAFP